LRLRAAKPMTSSTSIHCVPEAAGEKSRADVQLDRRTPNLSWYGLVYEDYRRYIATNETFVRAVFCCQGLWATTFYRVCRALVFSIRPRWLRRIARAIVSILQKFVEILTVGISMPIECEVGKGLHIGHHGTIILPAHGSLGENCSLGHSVTIGVGGRGERRGAPRIGNRVFIGTQSVIAGKIVIGDDVMICAGSIVTRSIPPRAVVVGNPGRVVSYDGSFDHIAYDDMDADPQRLASLALRGQPVKSDPENGAVEVLK
jgi:serine O-acetyltransferase